MKISRVKRITKASIGNRKWDSVEATFTTEVVLYFLGMKMQVVHRYHVHISIFVTKQYVKKLEFKMHTVIKDGKECNDTLFFNRDTSRSPYSY